MNSLLLVLQICVVATFAAPPQAPFPRPMAGRPLISPESVHVPPVYTDLKVDLPNLQAALAYLTSSQAELDACGRMFQVYLGQIQAGRSQEQATLAATAQYQQDWLSGRLQLSAACAAADRTWRQEYAHGRDPLLPAARAYIEA